MSLPIKVEVPTLAPYRCTYCVTGHRGGPLLDMLSEDAYGRHYVCLRHAELIAVAAGFAEGEEMERLKNAAVLLAEAEKGIAAANERNENLAARFKSLNEHVDELTAERDQAQLRLAQTEGKLAELGQGIGATLAAVGNESEALPGGKSLQARMEEGK